MKAFLKDDSSIKVAQMLAMTFFLLSLCYINFVVKFFFGFPYLYSGSAFHSLGYYSRIQGHTFSLADIFVWLSYAGTVVSFLVVIITSQGSKGKWRQRLLIPLIGCIPIGFSTLPSRVKILDLEMAEYQLESFDERGFLDVHGGYIIVPESNREEYRSKLVSLIEAAK